MNNPSSHGLRKSLIPNLAILLAAVFSVALARAGLAADVGLPEDCRLALVLDRAFWIYANPTNPGTVTVYVERRAGAWDPTFSADAQRGLNVAHDGYLVASSSEAGAETLRMRLHIRQDRWMDVVGEAAYEVRFKAEGDRYTGTWRGVVHGQEVEGKVAGAVKPVRVVPGFVPPAPGEHPRLLIRKRDLPALRAKAATPWGKQRMAEIQADGSLIAQAFVHAMTGSTQAVESIKAKVLGSAEGSGWHCIGGDQHTPAFRVAEQLMAFDLIHDACDPDVRQCVAEWVADKLEMFYWGAYNTQFNGYDRSNWSLMFRSAAGIMALAALDTPLDNPDPPARSELLHLAAPRDLAVGTNMPVVVQDSEKPVADWLYAGPAKEPFNGDGFSAAGGMAKARPQVGTRVGDAEFRRLGAAEVKEGRDLGSREMRNGAVDLRKAAKGEVYVANYLYCVLEVKESGFYRLDSNSNPKGVRWTVAYLSGEKVMPKDYLRLDAGRHPFLVRVWNEPVGGWEPHVVWFRIVKVEEKEAMAWHLPRAAGVAADRFCGEDWRAAVAKKTPWNLTALRHLRQAQHEAEGYFTKGLGDFGWNQEGEAYTRHAIRLGIPFAYCFRNVFGLDMDGADRLGLNMALCTAATIFSNDGARMQSFAVGGGPMDADLYSRAMGFVPERLLPAVLWAANRTQALAEADKLTDPHGVIAAHDGMSKVLRFIHTPLDVAERNPDGILSKVTVDRQKGGYVFRNRWRDGDDCVVQLFANSNTPGGTWSSSEGGTFRLDGLGQSWVVRGQSYGNGASARSLKDISLYQSMVDVAEHNISGCPQAWTTHSTLGKDGSGVVTLNMDEVYQVEENKMRKDIGIRAVRSFAVDYSGASGAPCLVAVADRLTGTQGSNTWQMAIPRELDVAVTGGAFTITAKSGETLKGTVVRPARTELRTVDYEHVHEINYHGDHRQGKFLLRAVLASGVDKDQEFLVVMTLQRGDALACEVKDGRVHVGKQTVSFDGKNVELGVLAGQ